LNANISLLTCSYMLMAFSYCSTWAA